MKNIISILFFGIMLTSCSDNDLLIVPRQNADANSPNSYCTIDSESGNLIVTIKSSFTETVNSVEVLVEFPGCTPDKFMTNTSSIPPNGKVDVSIPIPMGCFNPDCSYKVVIDPDNKIKEKIEGNNEALGICIG